MDNFDYIAYDISGRVSKPLVSSLLRPSGSTGSGSIGGSPKGGGVSATAVACPEGMTSTNPSAICEGGKWVAF
jgi:hypothetical protein